MNVSESYRKADCCGGQDCDYLGRGDDEPCWGQVDAVDEIEGDDDWYWVHACRGHRRKTDGEAYIKEERA